MPKPKNIVPLDASLLAQNDIVVFDANVWVKIWGIRNDDTPLDRRVMNFYKKILSKPGVKIHVLETILSECVNVMVSDYYHAFKDAFYEKKKEVLGSRKDFIKSEHFKPIAAEISNLLVNVLESGSNVEYPQYYIEKTGLLSISNVFGEGGYDFNDLLIEQYCRDTTAILVTCDSDFLTSDIKVMSPYVR